MHAHTSPAGEVRPRRPAGARGHNGSDLVVHNPAASGGAAVVELDVIESDQLVLHEGQVRQPGPRVAGVRVVEQQDRPGAVDLEKDVPD